MGIETAFSVMYTHLVQKGVITLERLIDLLAVNPRKRFGIPMDKDFCVWDLSESYVVDPENFLSKGSATPFEGWQLNGVCKMTVCDGKIVYKK